MSVELLDKTRKINKLLHNNNSHKVVFNDICKVLSEILLSNILVISKKGKVLGVSICPGVDEIHELIEDKVGGYVDKMFNERLLSVLSTKENVNLATLGFAEENVKKYQAIIAPIDIAGERLGTLFMYKSDAQYDIDEMCADLRESVAIAKAAGVKDGQIILDPGVGFGKTYENNLTAIHHLERLIELGYPVLLATSRKSVIGLTLDLPTEERVEGTLVTTVLGVQKHASFVRVHDVKENMRAIRMTQAIMTEHKPEF